MNEAILSISPHRHLLELRKHALENAGFVVISVNSEVEALFEIRMGQCGVLVLCHRLHQEVHRSLSSEFRKYCVKGVVVGIMAEEPASPPKHLDLFVRHSERAEALVAALLKHPETKKLASRVA